MSLPYYIRRNNQVKGPFPAGQISQALLIGRFRLNDEVSTDREEWKPIQTCPELIPEVLKGDPNDPENAERLAAARRWADERRPVHGDNPDDLRRNPESNEVLEYREHRESIYRRLGRKKNKAILQSGVVLLLLVSIVYLGFTYMPVLENEESQCNAVAAPGIDWRSCRLAGMTAIRSDLQGAKLNSAILTGSNFFGANLQQSQLDYAELRLSNLSFVNFANASMKGVDLQQADLTQANMKNTNLEYANLSGAKIDGLKLDGARLDNAIWIDGETCLSGSVGGCKIQKSK